MFNNFKAVFIQIRSQNSITSQNFNKKPKNYNNFSCFLKT